MDAACDLEVDVNGEGVFMVNKGILSSYCGKLIKLFSKSSSNNRSNHLKVIFHNFPGSSEGFELVARFCYNNGVVEITPTNITLLYCASQFMEMSSSVLGGSRRDNLAEQIVKSLEDVSYYTWSDLITALKQTQDASFVADDSSYLADRFLAALVGRITLTTSAEPSPCPSTSSPESSGGFRVSCDSRSTESLKTSCCSRATTWWFEELLFLNPQMIDKAVKFVIGRKFDHALVGRLLLYYQKAKSLHAGSDEKCRIMDTVIDNLCSLDHGSVSCKGLFMLLRAASNLMDMNRQCRMALEALVGSRLDEATLDNLLMPAPHGVKALYDVDLVLRLLRMFRNDNKVVSKSSDLRMRKVADLLDLFLAEVAPDPYLKPSKLVALAVALPDSARESYDDMYHAIDMYLQVHTSLSEEERLNVCCVLNYEKLSSETCLHLSHNKKFSSRTAVQTLVHDQQLSKLKDLLQEEPIYTPRRSCYDASSSPFNHSEYGTCCNEEEEETTTRIDDDNTQMVLYAAGEQLDDAGVENEKLRAQLQGMQWRVMELEKVCRKMQSQMTKISKSSPRSSGVRSRSSLPKLCS